MLATLVKTLYRIFSKKNLRENRVWFPEERNASVFDHQHGRRDVTCKPAIIKFAGFETRGKLDLVNFHKDFSDCYYRQKKKIGLKGEEAVTSRCHGSKISGSQQTVILQIWQKKGKHSSRV